MATLKDGSYHGEDSEPVQKRFIAAPGSLSVSPPRASVLTSAAFGNRLPEPTIASRSLQARAAAGDIDLAMFLLVTPWPYSCGGNGWSGGLALFSGSV